LRFFFFLLPRLIVSLLLPKQLGNSYTGSLYTGLNSLVDNQGTSLAGKRILMFSYGSGLAATMFSLVAPSLLIAQNVGTDASAKALLKNIQEHSNLKKRLGARHVATPEEFTKALATREGAHVAPYEPQGKLAVAEGAYRLTSITKDYRRSYERV
jgi:hydroxymethylglutaryl-CoA synthase